MAERTARASTALGSKRRFGLRARSMIAAALAGTSALVLPASASAAEPALGSMAAVVDQIGARGLWSQGYTGRGVNVAVVDTGAVPVEGLLGADKVVAVVDLSSEADDPALAYLDTYGHGTHMAGIIAGRDRGAAAGRFLGVAPDAGIVSVKVGGGTGDVDVSQVIAGIDWVVEHAEQLDIGVLNLSFSSRSVHTYQTDPLTHAVERAWRAGIVVVAASGNDGLGQLQVSSPAMDPFVIAVGGLEATGGGRYRIPAWATNGNHLRNPDLGAPGASIVSLRSPGSFLDTGFPAARIGDRFFRGSGSSQAAAVVSGAVALLLQARPELTPDEVKALLVRSADPTVVDGHSAVYAGAGALRVDRALQASAANATQYHLRALGSGSLLGARGNDAVGISLSLNLLGISLGTDVTFLGTPWRGPSWPGTRWSGGTWNGTRWSDAAWMGTRWSGATWTAAEWVGTSWTGIDWSGTRWSGTSWSGTRWSGTRWSGTRWSAGSWSGTRWSGTRWSSAGWS